MATAWARPLGSRSWSTRPCSSPAALAAVRPWRTTISTDANLPNPPRAGAAPCRTLGEVPTDPARAQEVGAPCRVAEVPPVPPPDQRGQAGQLLEDQHAER